MAAPIYGFVPKDRHAEAACPAPADRADTPDKLYIAIDGTGVPMVPVAVAGRPANSGDGRARIREVKLACLSTHTSVDDQASTLPGNHSGDRGSGVAHEIAGALGRVS